MIVLHPSAESLLRRILAAGAAGLPVPEDQRGDLAALVAEAFATVTDGTAFITQRGAAHARRIFA